MMPLRSDRFEAKPVSARVAPSAYEYLDFLRSVAMDCRAMPRTDLFEACALLRSTKAETLHAYAGALMRCLNEALGKRAHLHAPGVADLTFDERWLLQLGVASATGDTPSLQFLLTSRVAPEHRRLVSFLIHQISKSHFPAKA